MPITQTDRYHDLKARIEQGSRRQIRHLTEFLNPHRCWLKPGRREGEYVGEPESRHYPTREFVTARWYRDSLRRSQRNIGAVIGLEIAIEAAAIYIRGDRQCRFLEYARDYAAAMRDACNDRPSVTSRRHRHLVPRVLDQDGMFPDGGDESHVGLLGRVLRICRQFFFSHTGSAFSDGWYAITTSFQLAVQADLVDYEYQAFALWWHTLRCRLAFHDSATCTFV